MKKSMYTHLFIDIGGVILTNGWDHHMREHAAQKFGLDLAEMNNRHGLTFDTYEIGKITLDDYLDRVIFYQPRSFSVAEFKEFMFSQSQPYTEMIQMLKAIKNEYGLRVVAVSNEGRELMDQRIKRFQLEEWIDFFVCSGFVGLRKPDYAIYRIALDMSYVDPEHVIYLDDRPLLAEIGRELGLQAIHHIDLKQTETQLRDFLSVTL